MSAASSASQLKVVYNLKAGWDDGLSDQDREARLNNESKVEMNVGRFEKVVDISKRFVGDPKGAVLAALVVKYYFSRNRHPVKPLSVPNAAPTGAALEPSSGLVTPYGIKMIRRPPLNNRDEGQSRKQYESCILSNGYQPEFRAPPVMKRTKHAETWCAPSAGTCF